MAKKKKSRRKQQRLQLQRQKQYQAPTNELETPKTVETIKEPAGTVSPTGVGPGPKSTTKKPVSPKKQAISDQIAIDATEHAYVKADLRRIGILVLGLIGAILVLWFILEKTSLGPTVFHLIKI